MAASTPLTAAAIQNALGAGDFVGRDALATLLGNALAGLSTGQTLADNSGGAAAAAIAAGVGKTTLAFFVNLKDIASGEVLTDYVPGYKFKINSVDFRVAQPASTGGKAATITTEINTTAVTGGSVALTTLACTPAGAAVAGSAVSALNTGGAADSISILASSVTAFVEGTGWIIIGIQNMDVADACASLIATLLAAGITA